MTPIENRILLSDLKTITKKSELKHLINFTIAEGLEGLVLKVSDSYRHMTCFLRNYCFLRIPMEIMNQINVIGLK
jgi:hypothetical protein